MLEHILPGVAAIDIGRERLFVAVAEQPVRNFGTFTSDITQLGEYLKAHGVQRVAMEATGVYWIPVHDQLQAQGLEVTLFNGRQARNLPGRKSDVADCQWHAMLHGQGLLRPCFVPPEEIRQLRSYQRLREDHIGMAAMHIQHMHKALDLMNVCLHRVISQLHGVSGLRLVRAILAGERDPERLLQMCEAQIVKHKREAVLKSLEGDWQEHHLFALRQALAGYEFYQARIAECDQQLEALLVRLTKDREPCVPPPGTKVKVVRHNAPAIDDLHGKLLTLCGGADASQIGGLTSLSHLKLIAEIGTDLGRWRTKKQFTAWLGLAPGMHQSGKKRRQRVPSATTAAGQIFRECALSLAKSKHKALGSFYRRLKGRRGHAIAIKAVARKLAEYYYDVMTKGLAHVEVGLERYEAQYRQQAERYVRKLAGQLGLRLLSADGVVLN
jgi:transposase